MSDGALQEDLQDRQIGDFRLLRLLGRGGMADVYLADQVSLKRQVALKVLRQTLVSDEVYLRRFRQESTAAAALNHPHIVQVYAIGFEDGLHYIAQEYVHGWNLRDLLKREGPPDAATVVRLMQQTASALQAAGEAGIVHRDIKPENLLVTRKGDVKVADFGLAQLNRSDDRLQLTQIGMTMGTPLYMSPEQVNGQRLDQRSDIYSLGVTCYHLLAGAAPFQGETALSVAVKHVNEEPIALSTRRADLPRALCDTIHKMMAKNPADRYQSFAALLEDLGRLTRSEDQAAERSSDGGRRWPLAARQTPEPRGWTRSPIRRLPRRALWMAAACLLAGVTSAAVGWWLRPGNPLETSAPEASGFPRQETAQAQFYLAQRLVDDEAAWRAVIDYFPAAKLESRRAKEHLALVLLRDRRFDEARALFDELAAEDNDDDASRTRGLAGLAALASIEEDYQKSQLIISLELLPLRRFLDERTRDLVIETVRRNQQYVGDQLEQDLEELLRSPPESADEIRSSG